MQKSTRKCPKALKKRVVDCTQDIFNDCLIEVFDLDPRDGRNISDAAYIVRQVNRGLWTSVDSEDLHMTTDEVKEKRDKVEAMYQEKIKQLSTKQLNEILKAHNLEDGLRRAPKTIETITSELARRALLDDSGESDFISLDGEPHESTRPGSKRRKKATRKKRKAIKSR